MKTGAIIQARMTSTRLPGKMAKELTCHDRREEYKRAAELLELHWAAAALKKILKK